MRTNLLSTMIAIALACAMALPAGMAVTGNSTVTDPMASILAPDTNVALANLGDTIYKMWVAGTRHDSRLLASSSRDGGVTWTRPTTLTGEECTPMNVLAQAGDRAIHIVWQDGSAKLLRTGYISIDANGHASKPLMFQGECPELAVSADKVAFTHVLSGMMTVEVSHDGGESFEPHNAFPGLSCRDNSLSFSASGLEIVAEAGIRDPDTGRIVSRGIYFSSFDGAWSVPNLVVGTGAVGDLSLDSGMLFWTENSSGKLSRYSMTETSPGVFGDKTFVSSEEPPIAQKTAQQPLSRLPQKKWTYIGYIDADNSLNDDGYVDVNEMETVGSDDDLNIVVLFDGAASSADDSCAWFIEQDADTSTITSPEIPLTDINPSWGSELNMGDPQVAIDFVNYVYENYPADRYIWDMWNHGGSWLYGMCSDDTDGDDLTMEEVRSIYETLRTDNNKLKLFDVAGYDECLMSDVSNDYDEMPYIDYICNSEDSIPGDGWEYDLILGAIASDPDMGGEEAAWEIFDAYVQRYGTSGGLSTMSIINSSMFALELLPAINNLAQKGIHDISANRIALQTAANNAADWQGYTHQKDLLDFCANIVGALPANEIRQAAQEVIAAGTANPAGTQYGTPAWQHDRAILIHNQNSGENGVTIYAARPPYNSLYDTMTFIENNWDEFYKVLWGSDASDPNDEPTIVITNPSDDDSVCVDSLVIITGTSDDTDGTVQGVEVSIDTEHWEPATGTSSWTFVWDTTGWELGTHRILARSFDGQDFSAPQVISVQVVDVTSNGTVDIQFPRYPAEASIKVTVKDTDLNTDSGVQTTVILTTSGAEPAGETLLLTETSGDTGVFEGFMTISGTDSAGTLWVNAADVVTATYGDADYGGTGPRTLKDTALIDGTPPGAPAALTVEWYGLFEQTIYSEDFEGDGTPTFTELGWTTGGASNDWQIGTPAGLGTPSDPFGACSGSFSIGNDLTGLGVYPGEYENGLAVDSNYIYSPAIDCTGYSAVELSFMRYLGIESASFDHAYVEASTSASGPWTQIWGHAGTSDFMDTSWTRVSYSLSPLADNQPAVYVRFEMGSTDGSVTFPGWNIDDVTLTGMTPGTMDNTLNWTLSSDDGAGANDVARYNIYRSTSQSGPWDAYALIYSLGRGKETYADLGRGEFDGTNWWYVVRAEDDLGNEDQNTQAIPEVVSVNIAPSAPSLPAPPNSAIGVSVNPTLSVRALDPNGDSMTVSFYSAAGPTLLGTSTDVPSGTYASVPWNGLSELTSYSWYATADDGEFISQSSTWSFTTMDITPPGPPTGLAVDWTGTCDIVLIGEDFSSTTFPPDGWTASGPTSQWTRETTALAGGTSPEAMFSWVEDIDVWRLYAGPFDTAGISEMDLEWNNYYADYDVGVTVKVQTSSDAATWHDTGWAIVSGNGNVGPALATLSVGTADVGSGTFYLAFTVEGDAYQLDYWYIDDVLLTYAGVTTDDNLLTWLLSSDDGAGADDVTQYNIYRSDISTGPWDVAHMVDTVPAGTDTITDLGRGESDGINWWYVVRAEDIWGNEETNADAVPEVGAATPPYAISLAGKPANSWVFVSFPSGVTGSIQTLLNDAAAGDSGTVWSVAKWYNPQTPNDPWKSYRVGGTANDMPAVSNAMGFWIWLTANGGDQMLTLGSYAAAPATANINLYVGWNLVGYPSATDRSGSTTPAAVDIISVYGGAAIYIDYTNKALVTLHHGNAYFLHVTVDCAWTVTNP